MKYLKRCNMYKELLKTKYKGRLLGLDVGDKYVGLAVSDPSNKIASPLSVLLRKKTNMDLVADDLKTLISEFSIAGFVVGYPFDREQSVPNAIQVKLFIDDLCATETLKGVKYTYWDESYTSKIGEYLISSSNLHPVLSKSVVDKIAAVGILQGYLDYYNKKVKLDTGIFDARA